MSSELHDPFVDGDIIWFESKRHPVAVFYKQEGFYYKTDLHKNKFTLEELINLFHMCSGPYRAAEVENWSAADFTDPDVINLHPYHIEFTDD